MLQTYSSDVQACIHRIHVRDRFDDSREKTSQRYEEVGKVLLSTLAILDRFNRQNLIVVVSSRDDRTIIEAAWKQARVPEHLRPVILILPPTGSDLSYVSQFYLQHVLLRELGVGNIFLFGFKSGGLDFLNFCGVSTLYLSDEFGCKYHDNARVSSHLPALFPALAHVCVHEHCREAWKDQMLQHLDNFLFPARGEVRCAAPADRM